MNSATIEAPSEPHAKRLMSRDWMAMTLVVLLLGVSGGIRHFRDWHFRGLERESEERSFPLSEIPNILGSWSAVEGQESVLEPDLARIAGARESLIRKYHDSKTGQDAVVMVLYGLAAVVSPHSPAICYPAQGFQPVPAQDRVVFIDVPEETRKARFRLDHFSKTMPSHTDYRIVYHSYLNAGRWDFDVEKRWKTFRYYPGMYKVQVQREGKGSGPIDETALEELVGRIVHEIDRRQPSVPSADTPKA